MIEVFLLIIGLLGLWLGAELVIRGALNIAEHYKISHIFLGLTILAIGTDLPELTVTITGALHKLSGTDTSGLIVGETIGTSFGQIGLALGIAGLFGVLLITKRQLLRDGLVMAGSVVLLFLVSLDGEISQIDGVILALIYLFYFITLFREEKLHEKIKRAPRLHIFWSAISLLGGFAILIFSSNLTIDNALLLSEKLEIAQSLVGILIVGLGTSIPELAISIAAVRKKAGTMAVGNLIGSNTFDILFTLGLSSAISGFNVSRDLLFFDIPALFVISIIVLLLFMRNKKLEKKEAIILIALYLIYILLKITVFPGS